MNPRRSLCRLSLRGFGLLLLLHAGVRSQQGPVQDNPVLAPELNTVPILDGTGDDQCWQNLPWQSIQQVWIPYGGTVASNDYTGRYKVVWSSTTDLLYFLVEVTDDVFVDGFNPGVSSEIYHFDIIEVFIDEDSSGGLHVFDGTGTVGDELGTNAENAFAYHIYAPFPGEGQTTTSCFAGDLDGTSWADQRSVNNAAHFPSFVLRKTGHTAVWEFSLIVYDDTYEVNTGETARVRLQVDKEMGLSLAYCDNDDPDELPIMRDNMFGSVYEPPPGNMHWMNADYFGRLKLVSDIPTGINEEKSVRINTMKFFPNPASTSSELVIDTPYRGEVSIRLFNLLGQELYRRTASKANRLFMHELALQQLPPGLYFVQTQMGRSVYNEKLVIIPGK